MFSFGCRFLLVPCLRFLHETAGGNFDKFIVNDEYWYRRLEFIDNCEHRSRQLENIDNNESRFRQLKFIDNYERLLGIQKI